MKRINTLGLAVVATAALMAILGVGTASATTLTGEGGSVLPTGSEIHAVNEGNVVFTTSFMNVTCEESTLAGKTTNETGSSVSGTISVLTFKKCNCLVSVIKGGTFSLTVIGSGPNGTLSSSGAEITESCETIFGIVHCIVATNNTHLGALTGSNTTGSTATIDIESASIPYLPTNGLCSNGTWDAKYKVDKPDALNVIS